MSTFKWISQKTSEGGGGGGGSYITSENTHCNILEKLLHSMFFTNYLNILKERIQHLTTSEPTFFS